MPSRAGRPNKNKAFLLNRLQDMYGEDFHPIMKMAENAILLQAEAEKELDAAKLKTAVDTWDKVAKYKEQKLTAIEGRREVNESVVRKG